MATERSHSQQSSEWRTKDAVYGEEERGDIDLDGGVISLFFFLFSVIVLLVSLIAMIIRRLRRCKENAARTRSALAAGGYIVDEEAVEKHCPSFVWKGAEKTMIPGDTGVPFNPVSSKDDGGAGTKVEAGAPSISSDGASEPGIIFPSVCCICLEAVVVGEELRKLERCNHIFHKSCVDAWLLRPKKGDSAASLPQCPQCRRLAWLPEGMMILGTQSQHQEFSLASNDASGSTTGSSTYEELHEEFMAGVIPGGSRIWHQESSEQQQARSSAPEVVEDNSNSISHQAPIFFAPGGSVHLQSSSRSADSPWSPRTGSESMSSPQPAMIPPPSPCAARSFEEDDEPVSFGGWGDHHDDLNIVNSSSSAFQV